MAGHSRGIRHELFKFLLEHPDEEFESYQLEHRIKAAKTTINGYLRDMELDSLVRRRMDGYYCYWRVNRMAFFKNKMLYKKWTPDLFAIAIQKE